MKQLNDLNYLFALAAVTSDMRLSLSLSFIQFNAHGSIQIELA